MNMPINIETLFSGSVLEDSPLEKVFIAGPLKIRTLDKNIKERLDNIIQKKIDGKIKLFERMQIMTSGKKNMTTNY